MSDVAQSLASVLIVYVIVGRWLSNVVLADNTHTGKLILSACKISNLVLHRLFRDHMKYAVF